jgi:hypothetical protein
MKKNTQPSSQEQENIPQNERYVGSGSVPRQIIPEKGEEYLRESGNIEDLPNEKDDRKADEKLRPSTDNEHINDPRRAKDGPLPGSL